ncbi:hypothetical protein GZ78_11095 [Endozoicomonas numazuensis]|uniref:Uncharacterized protein n=1 Tax=Endozoicomonas numazuensis TaxID=1137799 RepID=A0A081NI34_9GAMM|nr:hypothetical protein GZ78_11095 [Endozoicomonas numazuensis]
MEDGQFLTVRHHGPAECMRLGGLKRFMKRKPSTFSFEVVMHGACIRVADKKMRITQGNVKGKE